jgi:membrane associated rhomboid family serine protease/Flp pilus assembly protein TadD
VRIPRSSAPPVMTESGLKSPTRDVTTWAGPLPRRISATAALIVINLTVFLAMAISGGHLVRFSGDEVFRWGANYGPFTMNGQLWRLITAMFVHIGLAHLLINMWCLYELALLTEHIYSRLSVFLIYGLAGIAGEIASLARNPTIMSAGASGAIFGLAGVLITTLLLGKLTAPRRELKIALASLLAFAAYNLTYGFLKGGVDNGAHVGGLISGLLIGAAVSRNAGGKAQFRRQEGLVYVLTLVVLVAGYAAVLKVRGEVIGIEAARVALAAGDPKQAIRGLSHLPATTNNPQALALLANAYTQKKQYAEAEKCYRRSLQLNARDSAAHNGLGVLLAATGRLQEASQELQKAVAFDPGAQGAWLELGIVLQKLGRHADAAAALKTAAALNPNSPQTQFALGISEMNLRQYDAAIAAFQKAVRLAPNNYDAQIWLANAYQAGGRTNEAAAAYMRAAHLRRSTLATPGPVSRR